MRAVVQRVTQASVTVEGRLVGAVGPGVAVLLGVKRGDGRADVEYIGDRIVNLRIFPDEEGRMNRSLLETGGEALIVSQFTLYGDARKGRRPSYLDAAGGVEAEALYEAVCERVQAAGPRVARGEFGAMMQVALVNDGPVTILLDSSRAF